MAKQNTLLLDYLKSKKEDKQEAENSASKNRSSLLKDYLSQGRESNKSVNAESLSERLVNPSYRSPLPAAPSEKSENETEPMRAGGYRLPQITALDRLKIEQQNEMEKKAAEQLAFEAKYGLNPIREEETDVYSLPAFENTGITVRSNTFNIPISQYEAKDIRDELNKNAEIAQMYGADIRNVGAAEQRLEKRLAASQAMEDRASGKNTTILPGITVPFEKTEDDEETLKDKAIAASNAVSYTAGALGAGAADTLKNMTSGITQTVGDIATGGGYSEGYRQLENYFAQNGSEDIVKRAFATSDPVSALTRDLSAVSGVPANVVRAYIDSVEVDYILNKLGENVSDTVKNGVGNWSYVIGQQLPGIMLTMGAPANAVNAIDELSSKVAKNAATAFTSASVYGDTINQLARQNGYTPSNYLNSALQATAEGVLEGAFGFSDASSYKRLITPTGNAKTSVLKGVLNYIATGAEEGIEEVINTPLSNAINAMTGTDSYDKVVGEGGIFDFKEMLKAGVDGAIVGLIMGGAAGIAGVASSVQESRDIKAAFHDIDEVISFLPDTYKPQNRAADASKMTMEDLQKYEAEALDGLRRYQTDAINGTAATKNSDSAISERLEAAISSSAENRLNAVSEYVRSIRDSGRTTKNAVNSAIDHVRAEIQRMNGIIANSSDAHTRQTAAINRKNYIIVDEFLRSNRKAIDARLAETSAQASTQSEPQTQTETTANGTAETVAESTPVQTNVQSDTAAETASEQEAELAQNAPQTTAQAARTVPEAETTENGGAIKYTVSDALNIPETDTPEAAAEEVVREYNGSVSDALDAVDKARENYTSENTDAAQEAVNRLNEVETAILTKNRAAVQKTANAYAPYLKRFGIDGVVVEDMKAGQNAYYDRNTRTIHLSSRISDTGAVGRFIVHEFTHRGAQIDMSLADSIVAAMDKSGGQAFVSEETIRNAYGDQLAGMTAEEADAYIREERAAHFMERIMENPDVLEEFRDDRTFLRKLLDAIQDFFTRNNPKGQEKIQLRRIERKINELLKAADVDAKVKAGGNTAAKQAESDVERRYSRELDSDGHEYVKVDDPSIDTSNLKEIPRVLRDIVKTKGFSDMVIKGQHIGISSKRGVNEWYHSKDAMNLLRRNPTAYDDKIQSFRNADELLETAKNFINEEARHKDKFTDFARGQVRFTVNGRSYSADILVGIRPDMSAELYDIVKLQSIKITAPTSTDGAVKATTSRQGNAVDNSISQNSGGVKGDGGNVRFSLELPVEESGELVAVHNLTEEKLQKTLRQGGFPMPSIAVVRASEGHNEFGDISVVFGKDSIDPKKNKSNKIYSGDAWTPTYPQVEYEASEQAEQRISALYNELSAKHGRDEVSALRRYVGNLEEYLNRYDGEQGIIDELKNNTDMMQIYRLAQGQDKVPDVVREVRTEMPEESKQFNEAMLRELGDDLMSEFQNRDFRQAKVYLKEHADEIREAYARVVEDMYDLTEAEAREEAATYNLGHLQTLIGDVKRYMNNGGVQVKTETDVSATRQAISDATDSDAYVSWLHSLFDGAVLKSGIRNDKDVFTASGKRRSFDALHYENTLENIVKAMKSQGAKGIGSFGGRDITGASTTEYSSIKAIKNDSGRLRKISEDEHAQRKREFTERLHDLAERLPANRGSSRAYDDAADMLVEAVAKYNSRDGMDRYLRSESEGWANYSPDILDELISLVNDIRSMPVTYFEAKPERVVSMDEVRAFVVPDTISSETRTMLEGKNVVEYTEGDTESRLEALNSLSDIRFSRDLETPEQRKIRRQQEQIDYLKRQLTSRTAFGWAKAVSPADRRKFAATIAAELPGVSVDEVSAAIKTVWDILERPKRGSKDTPEVRWKELQTAAEEAARNLVDSAVQTEVDPMYEQYRDLRAFLRTTPIKLNVSKEDMGGDEAYSKWRKGNLGLLRISDDPSARGIDSVYSEVSKQYPEFFPDDITDMSEMLRRLGDTAVELRQFAGNETVKVNPFEDVRDGFSADLANRILFGFDSLAQTTLAAREEYGAAANEADARRIHAEEQREAADRERTAYETGLRRGAESNEKLTQTELQRQEMMYQNFISDFRDSERKLQREIERQNKKVESLQNRIAKHSESDRLRVERAKTMSTLSRINTMLTKPNRSKHVPQSLRAPVARLLETLGTTRLPSGKTVNTETMRDIQEQEYARFESESIQLVDSMRTSIVNNPHSETNAVASAYLEKLRENIERLKMLHAEINEASPDDAVLPPDLATTKHTEYIRQVGKILSMVEHYIKDTDTVFLAGKTVAAKDFSERIISDMKLKKGRNEDKSELRRYFSGLGYEFVSADLFLEMMGDSGTELMKQYRRSQTVQAKCEEEYAEYMLEKTGGDYNTNKAGYNGQTISVSVDGKTLDVPRAQLMQLYLTWKRPAGRRHLRNGGAIFTNKLGQETKEATVQITDEIYRNLMSKLTDEDFRVADAIGWFLSKRCSEWGNDASMKMYGYRMFEDPNYFPLDVSQNAVPDNWDKMEEYYRLENAGMTKALKEDATAPLRMTDVFDVADFHVRTMAAYTAYAPVSNDVQRILAMPGVKEAINTGMGKKGWEYLEKLGKTIASNKVRTGDMSDAARPLQFLMNAYKRQAVSFNISTALKQPLSIVRALNEIDAKYIRQVPFSLSHSEYKRAYNAMIENSGVAKMKMLGYSDTGFGKSLRQIYDRKYTNESGIIRGSLSKSKGGRYTIKAYDKLTDAGMWAAGKADEATWVKLWKACELETKSEYPNLSADERLQKTADRFNEIIGRTQVVDTVLDTAPVMRNNAMAILTPFMNEPTKALATMITAADAVRDGKPHAKKKLAKAVGLVALNNLVLEPIISTLMSVWKDEEDDTENTADFVNKFLKYYIGINPEDGFSFTDFATSNVVGGVFSFPIIQIFYDTISDSLQNYGNEKIDTAALSNLVKSTTNLVTGVWKPKEDRTKTNYTLIRDFIGSAAAVAGIPANTFRRQISACLRSVLEITDNYELQWEYNKMLYNLENSSALSQKNFYDIMAAAYKAGDTEAYRKMRLELAAIQKESTVGVSASQITKAIEERGGEIEVGSALWNVDLQARFNLGEYVPYMKVESLITGVYKQLDDDSKTKVLYSYPNRSQLEESLNMEEDTLDYVVYEQYVHDSGKRAYQILTAMQAKIGGYAWKKLSSEQQAYAINRAYDFAKSYYKKKLYSDYKLDKWQEEAYSKNHGNDKVADKILELAKDYEVKQD